MKYMKKIYDSKFFKNTKNKQKIMEVEAKYSKEIAEKVKGVLGYDPYNLPGIPNSEGEIFRSAIENKMYNSLKNVIEKEKEIGRELMDRFIEYLPSLSIEIIPEKHGDTATKGKILDVTGKGKTLISLEFDEGRYKECEEQLKKKKDDGKDYMREAAVDLVKTLEELCLMGEHLWLYSDTDNQKVEIGKDKEANNVWLTRRNFHMACMIYQKLIEDFKEEADFGSEARHISFIAVHIGENHNKPEDCLNEGTIQNFLIGFGFNNDNITVS